MQEYFSLTEFKKGDFYSFSNKIVLNQTIYQKDFSEFFIRKVNFLNCSFDWADFTFSTCKDLTFERCSLKNVIFKKSELDDFIFKNCELTNVIFSRSDLLNFDFINCKLNYVYLNAGDLMDIKIDNSQLQDVYFSGSLLDNVKIKNSTLENLRFAGTEVYKGTDQNGVANYIPIKDYNSFLNEITFSTISSKKLPYQKLISRSFQFLAGIILSEIVVVFFYISTGNWSKVFSELLNYGLSTIKFVLYNKYKALGFPVNFDQFYKTQFYENKRYKLALFCCKHVEYLYKKPIYSAIV